MIMIMITNEQNNSIQIQCNALQSIRPFCATKTTAAVANGVSSTYVYYGLLGLATAYLALSTASSAAAATECHIKRQPRHPPSGS